MFDRVFLPIILKLMEKNSILFKSTKRRKTMKFKKCAALLLVSSCLLTGCTTSAKKVDSKYVVASLEKGSKTKNIFADNLYKDIIDNSSNKDFHDLDLIDNKSHDL